MSFIVQHTEHSSCIKRTELRNTVEFPPNLIWCYPLLLRSRYKDRCQNNLKKQLFFYVLLFFRHHPRHEDEVNNEKKNSNVIFFYKSLWYWTYDYDSLICLRAKQRKCNKWYFWGRVKLFNAWFFVYLLIDKGRISFVLCKKKCLLLLVSCNICIWKYEPFKQMV